MRGGRVLTAAVLATSIVLGAPGLSHATPSSDRSGAVPAERDGAASLVAPPLGSGEVRLVVGVEEKTTGVLEALNRGVAGEGSVSSVVRGVDAVTVTVDAPSAAAVVRRLEALSTVRYIEPETTYRAFGSGGAVVPTDPWFGQQVESLQMRFPQAWTTTTGAPTVVAVLDTGVTANSDLYDGSGPGRTPAVLPGYDFINNDADAADDMGHGTEVATVLAGRGENGFGIAGACWSCKILPVKVLDRLGEGTNAGIAAGITWAVDHGAKILNLSLGGPSDSAVLDDAVSYAIGKGAVVVASSGNTGESTAFPTPTAPQYPAAIPGVLSVGSVSLGSTDLYPQSARGPWVDVVAPNDTISFGPDDAVAYVFSGTSAAAPLVSGTVALLIAAHPWWTPGQVLTAVTSTTRAVNPAGVMGGGLVDAAAALQFDPNPTTTTTSSTTTTSTTTSTTWSPTTTTEPPVTVPVVTPPATTGPPDAPPSASLDPLPTWMNGMVAFLATATDDRGVTTVNLEVSGRSLPMTPTGGGRWAAWIDTRDLVDGPTTARVVATDTVGHVVGSPGVSTGVDNKGPYSLVWGPQGATVTGSVIVLVGSRDAGTGTMATLLVADGRFVGGFLGDGGTFVRIPVTRNGPFGIAAISVDNAGHASFSNIVEVNGRIPAKVKGRRVSRRR